MVIQKPPEISGIKCIRDFPLIWLSGKLAADLARVSSIYRLSVGIGIKMVDVAIDNLVIPLVT